MARRLSPTRDLPHAPRRRPHAGSPPGASAGFVLYVGLNGTQDGDTGNPAQLAEIAETLRDLARDLLPTAETYTALSVAPAGGTGDLHDLRDRLAHLQPLNGRELNAPEPTTQESTRSTPAGPTPNAPTPNRPEEGTTRSVAQTA